MKKYEAPTVIIVKVGECDVITTSMSLPIVPIESEYDW